MPQSLFIIERDKNHEPVPLVKVAQFQRLRCPGWSASSNAETNLCAATYSSSRLLSVPHWGWTSERGDQPCDSHAHDPYVRMDISPEDWGEVLGQLQQPALRPPGQHVPQQNAHNGHPDAPKRDETARHDWRSYEARQVYPPHACMRVAIDAGQQGSQ